jgi:hypothetical protein
MWYGMAYTQFDSVSQRSMDDLRLRTTFCNLLLQSKALEGRQKHWKAGFKTEENVRLATSDFTNHAPLCNYLSPV